MGIKKFFTDEENNQIVECIKKAECETSGEIMVHVERRCWGSPEQKAVKVFEKTGMAHTRERNGVLIYLALSSKKFAIIGDKGINEKVPFGFWDETVQKMQEFFKKGLFADGVRAGIEDAGRKLREFFPYRRGEDKNELSDDISVS